MLRRWLGHLSEPVWLLLLMSIPAWFPLLSPAYFLQAHDAPHSLFYVVEFSQTLRDGYLWPRWSPDFAFGYGYPLFNFYAPLAIYAAAVLHLLGLGIVQAVKLIYILATVGAGLTMYLFARRLFGAKAGLLAALVYMYAPFHLLENYVRSAFAEYVSLMVLPFILWAFTELIASPSPRRLGLAGLSYGLLALVHHTTFFTFTPFLMLYILVLLAGKAGGNWRQWLSLGGLNLAAGGLGVALAAIYLLPALFEQQYIQVEQWTGGSYSFAQHFVFPAQLLSPFWGYGYAGPGTQDDMAFQIGLVPFALLMVAVILLPGIGRQVPHRSSALIFILAALLSIWMMLPGAQWLWEAIPLAALIQFPWRLLIITTLSLSLVSAYVVAALNLEGPMWLLPGLVLLLGSYTYTHPQYTDVPPWYETPLAVINWDSFSVADRVGMVIYTEEQPQTSPLEAQYRAGAPLDAARVLQGDIELLQQVRGGASAAVRFQGGPGTLQFYTYNFPGWQVRLNGQLLPHRPEPPFGLITVDVPAGNNSPRELTLRMGMTPVRWMGTGLSLLAGVFVGLALLRPAWLLQQRSGPEGVSHG